jgi:molecular chaperone GrpE
VTEEKKPEAANPSEEAAAPGSRPSAVPPSDRGAGDAVPPSAPTRDPLAEAQAEAQRFKDQLLRTAADFDNFRKRTRRELEDAERRGRDDLLKEFLPVFDNLERATAHAAQADSSGGAKALADGINLVIRQFLDTLRKLGIERIEAVGKPFDPGQHEAIQQLETNDFPPGIIAAEVQAGYRTGERLVRPALVVVAKRPAAVVPDESSSEVPSDAPNRGPED